MPFLSEKQRRLCWIKYYNDIINGNKPKWDCYEWEKHTITKNKRKLPIKKVF